VDEEQIARGIGVSAIAFGALAVLTPRVLARTFGVRNINNEFVYMLRFAGVEDAGVGINLISAKDPESRRRLLMILVLVNGLNSVLAVPAGLSRRTTALMVASNCVVAAVAALPVLRSRPSRL